MNIQLKWLYRLGFFLLLLIVMYFFMKLKQIWLPVFTVIFFVLIPFFIAAFITYLLHPIVEKIHDAGLHRGIAVIIIYLLFFGGVGFAFYKGIPAIITQVKDLAENIPNLADQYRNWVEEIQARTSAWPNGMQEKIEAGIDSVEKALDRFLTRILDGFVSIINAIMMLAIIPFIAFYMLKDYKQLKKSIWYLTPRQWRQQGILFMRDVDSTLGNYIRGQLFVCLLIGSLSSILFWFVDMKYPLLLGFIIGVTNVIPYFGPVIGAIPAVIIAATMSGKMVVTTLIIVFILQFIEGNVLAPFIVGKSLHMHPLFIMFALLVGGEVGGIVGLILAVPILSTIKVALVHAKDHFVRHKYPTDSLRPLVKD